MGSSMGGLISFQIGWMLPNVFGKIACLSNSFWVDDRMIFEFIQETEVKRKNQYIYIDCGTAEKQLIRDNKRMCALLRRMGVPENNSVYCNFEKDAKHNEVDWAKRLYKPLIFLFGKKGKSK
jgi:predicted alpha/beta superfamily hydrolase